MTLRFVDSFDHYVTADLTEKWNSISSSTIIAGGGRRSTACLRLGSASQDASKTLDAQETWIVGFAMKISALPSSTATFLHLLDAGTAQCDVRLKTDGTLAVTRNGTTLGTSSFALSAGQLYYIEFKCFINDTTGTYEVRVDGSNKVSGTGYQEYRERHG